MGPSQGTNILEIGTVFHVCYYSEGNNATASRSQSHDSAQQVHDNEGIVHNVDSSDNEQEFITPAVACSGDENDTANAQAVSNDDHAASLTTPFLEV